MVGTGADSDEFCIAPATGRRLTQDLGAADVRGNIASDAAVLRSMP